MGMVVEGVATTKAAYELAQEKGIEMPITEAIYKVLYEKVDVKKGNRGIDAARRQSGAIFSKCGKGEPINMKKVRKAVIPAAGFGTRFLTGNESDGKRNVADRR